MGTYRLGQATTLEPPGGVSTTASHTWVQTGGPSASLSNPSLAQPSFVPEQPGLYQFSVTIVEKDGSTRVEMVQVQVAGPTISPTFTPQTTPTPVPAKNHIAL